MRYWVSDGSNAQGPFSPEQLRRIPGFTPETMVAPEDAQSASEWRPAKVFADISALFAEPLPPLANRTRPAPKPPENSCPRCAHKAAADAVFCTNCGVRISDGKLPQAPRDRSQAARWASLGTAAGLLLGSAAVWLLKPAPKAQPAPAPAVAAAEPAPPPEPKALLPAPEPASTAPRPRRTRRRPPRAEPSPVLAKEEPVREPERVKEPEPPREPEPIPSVAPAREPPPVLAPPEPSRPAPEPAAAPPPEPSKKSVVEMSPEELERYLKRSASGSKTP